MLFKETLIITYILGLFDYFDICTTQASFTNFSSKVGHQNSGAIKTS